MSFQVADAEALPFGDASFDSVLSTFGVMSAPDQYRGAAVMARVCKPGGRIGLANWTPDSLVGRMFKVLGRRFPPPAGLQPPSLWGVEAHLQSLLGGSAARLQVTPRVFNFRYRSAAHFIDVFRQWYGPVHKAFAGLPAEQALVLAHDLTELLDALGRLCGEAGFVQIGQQRQAATLAYADGDEACRAAFVGGPVALAWSRLSDEARKRACARYLAGLAAWRDGAGFTVPAEFVIVAAVAPGQ